MDDFLGSHSNCESRNGTRERSINIFIFIANVNETMTDEAIQTHYGRDTVMATVKRMADGKIIEYKLSDFPVAEKLEKFMEDVK